jgi:hypothetical protein
MTASKIYLRAEMQRHRLQSNTKAEDSIRDLKHLGAILRILLALRPISRTRDGAPIESKSDRVQCQWSQSCFLRTHSFNRSTYVLQDHHFDSFVRSSLGGFATQLATTTHSVSHL